MKTNKKKEEKQSVQKPAASTKKTKKTANSGQINAGSAPIVLKDPAATLEKIHGKQPNNFGTLEPSVYEDKLRNMDKWDLYNECQKIGLIPHDNKERMIRNLMKQFNQYVAGIRKDGFVPHSQPNVSQRTIELVRKGLL